MAPLRTMSYHFIYSIFFAFRINAAIETEYQLESQPLRPCELARERALAKGESYIPQCSSEGLYRSIQCSRNGQTCWCVNANGVELAGSKQTDAPPVCLSFCQLAKQQILVSGYINNTSTSHIPQCKDSGEFESVQCRQETGQCWCVDSEGMEIYGTRKTGKPSGCPRSCQIRDRRILHGFGEKIPPHCSEDGTFQPVQCKLVNATDKMAVDVVTSFSRFPEAFKSFSSLRESFPEISGYCYCADSLGRELAGTGLELLLNEVYDTVFAGLSSPLTFTETTIYRILQRRFLGVRLITSGKFRCPSICEVQRFTASQMGDTYVPSCDDNGDFKPIQCQTGQQCWCVDSKGREIYGTRRFGDSPSCNIGDCSLQRRQALSSLFYGPIGNFGMNNLFVTQEEDLGEQINTKYCSSYMMEMFVKSGLLFPIMQKASGSRYGLDNFVGDMVSGLFPSKELMQFALNIARSPKNFQENLFGGMYLKNLGSFNFSGAVGTNSKFNFSGFFQQIGLTGMYSGGDFRELAKLFSPTEDSYLTKDILNISKPIINLNQSIQGDFGLIVNLQENRDLVGVFASVLELEDFALFLQDVISVPSNVAQNTAEAVKLILLSNNCEKRSSEIYIPVCKEDGRYEDIQCSKTECWCVDDQGSEIERTKTQGKHPRCPTKCEKEHHRQRAVRKSLPPGSEFFIPACDLDGNFMPVQCMGKLCFCVDLQGRIIPGTQKVSGEDIQCPSLCQLTAGDAFLQSTMSFLAEPTLLQLSTVYVPQCTGEGKWKPVQCDGPAEHVFELYELWTKQSKNNSFLEAFNIIQKYKRTSSQNFSTFVKELYNNGHQNVFPIFLNYNTFNDIPAELLSGNLSSLSNNILLNPLMFWRLLNGSLTFYPGPYSAFSQPLNHFELRNCWCVDLKGQKLEQTVSKNEVPKCPTSCELAKLRAMQFINEAADLTAISNTSHFPWGQSFLIASGIQLAERELLHRDGFFTSGVPLSERFRDRDNYSLRLAAQSTLQFHRQQRNGLARSTEEVSQVAYHPYVPQCDGLGNWEPVQFYESTGHHWCVDEDGNYIAGSLKRRTSRPPHCQTKCQQDQTNMLVSSWLPRTWSPQSGPVDMVVPGCTENGQFSALQTSESRFWCVIPNSGQVIQRGTTDVHSSNECPGYCGVLKSELQVRNVSFAFVPECGENGDFSSMQCDQDGTMCFCIFPDGEEGSGTRLNVSEMEILLPVKVGPICPLAFGAQNLRHGAVFCENILEAGATFQKCQLVCRKGYRNVLPQNIFMCNTNTQLWGVHVPHPGSCQKIQSFQSIQTQAQFQLLLPIGKKCMAEYSGLLQAFRTFILDDLRARGLCQIQVNYFGSRGAGTVPVCDESTVFVECLSVDRLRVNITWTAQLEDFPESFMPSLHDIEDALIGESLAGRFATVIKSGNYSLNLDSKEFVADTSVFFPYKEELGSFPQASLGCSPGFLKLLNSKTSTDQLNGCVICPAGSFAQNEVCKLCPLGFYQVEPGSTSCTKCPLGTSTMNAGAYNRSHCVTSCQMNSPGLLCDTKGQYLPSQKDMTTDKYFCVDVFGKRLIWTEADMELSDAQCLLLRKFELVPEDKLLLTGEDSKLTQPKQASGPIKSLLDCITDCGTEESCDYISVSTNGSSLICEQYDTNESNIVCTDDQQKESVLGNMDSVKVANLKCQMKIKQRNIGGQAVYQKKGYAFSRSGQALFERTDFGNTLAGAFKTLVFSAEGSTLNEVHLFCQQVCRKDPCCHGFILSQVILNKGTILCGLLSSPDVLLCNENDWSETSLLGSDGVCKGVKSNKEKKMFSFFLGGQEFTGSYSMLSESIGKVEYTTELTAEVKEEIQQVFVTFQRVFLKRGRSGNALSVVTDCSAGSKQQQNSNISGSALDLFLPVESNTVATDPRLIISSQHYGISRVGFSSDQALLWCLTRCEEEELWCRLTDLQETTEDFFTCTLYSDAWKCNNSPSLTPDRCEISLHNKPQLLYRKKDMLGNTVRNFYTRLPFRQITGVSVRRKIDMTGRTVSNGFFKCELHCDADPCCKGFGYLQRSQEPGIETLCLLLSSMGIQSCSDKPGNQWQVLNCSSSIEGLGTHPFGWFKKPDNALSRPSSFCPPEDVLEKTQEDFADWLVLEKSSVVIDPSLSAYDIVQIGIESSDDLQAAQNYCLAVCSRVPSCVTTTVALQKTAVRCLFYPDTQSCFYGLKGHQCQLLVKEPAAFIFRRKVRPHPLASVAVSHGTLLGKSEAIVIGSNVKNVVQFLGIPYASPPVGLKRFSPPQPINWTGEWNATYSRASCLQPGDGKAQYSSVSEDCLYLNVFVPQHAGTNAAVLLYFHNSPSDYSEKGQTFIDGSYLAAIGNIVVVTASYRVGVFGFLSKTGEAAPSGNWGLLDQVAALKWVQENVAYFGGDPSLISIAADRAGADISSIHMIVPERKLFRRALLMGGSAFSPMMVISEKRAKEQVRFLAAEVGCSSPNNNDVLTCLQGTDAGALNAAQTKLLAQKGPFQTWGPIVDNFYVKETPSRMLQHKKVQKIDLLTGSSEQDGLISRAKAIKRFEETQGRVDKTAFYQALQNSLGGDEANSQIQDAAVWFYSLEHSSDDYTGFSKALEKASRDHFIACPVVKMARHWAENSKGNIYMYYVPDSLSQSSSGLDLPEDVVYAFGLPFHTNYKSQFSSEEQILSLKIMQYVSNFVKTGNPNFPYKFSRRISKELPAWPMYLAHSNGTNYKEFSLSLTNNQGLKNSECSFWNDYIQRLKESTRLQSPFLQTEKTPESKLMASPAPTSPKQEKEGYNRRK